MRFLLAVLLALSAGPAQAQMLAPVLRRTPVVPALSVSVAGVGISVAQGRSLPLLSLTAPMAAALPSAALPAPTVPKAVVAGRAASPAAVLLGGRVRAIETGSRDHAAVLSSLFDGDGRTVEDAATLVLPGAPAWDPGVEIAGLESSVRSSLPALKASVAERTAPDGSRLSLSHACCGWAAPELGALLREQAHPVEAVEAEFHVYLIRDLPEGRLFIDPSIRQFFGGARAPPEIPEVFVGTREQLFRLFAEHRTAKSTRFDARRIYFSEAKVRNELIEEVKVSVEDILSHESGLVTRGPLLTAFQEQALRGRRQLARFISSLRAGSR